MRNIDSAPTVRATYLLVMCLEEKIIATYLLLLQQPIYYSSFWGNLLASPTLTVHPVYPWLKHMWHRHRLIGIQRVLNTSRKKAFREKYPSIHSPAWPSLDMANSMTSTSVIAVDDLRVVTNNS